MTIDLLSALRTLRRDPTFTAAAVATLAIGIGANIAVYAVVRTVLLAPLPITEPDRIVVLTERRASSNNADLPVSGHEFFAWKEQTRTLDALALYHGRWMNLSGAGEPETVETLHVSGDYFPLLGLDAARGRRFEPSVERANAEPVAILSDAFWRRRFGSEDVLGRSITLDDRAFTVIGIMPPLPASFTPDLWVALDEVDAARAVGRHNLNALGRLAPNVGISRAQADLDAIATRLEAELPAENTDHSVRLTPLREALTGEFRRPLLLILLGVLFVLLITCANVANLLLARSARRRTEFAIRTALGASRWRLLRQLLVESLVLAALGGLAGLTIAWWIVEAASQLTAVRVPLLETARLDWHVLAYGIAVTIAAGLAAGIAPALRRAQLPLRSLRTVTRTSSRLRSAIVATEVAVTLVLLVGTGLMVSSFLRLTAVDAGFRTRDVLVTPLELPTLRYRVGHQTRAAVERLLSELHATPGVASAAVVSHLPLGGADNWMSFSIDGRPPAPPGQEPNAPFRVVTGGYFDVMGIPLRRGRTFNEGDARRALPLIRWYPQQPYPSEYDLPQAPPVAVISESAARQFWPEEDPIGKRIRVLLSPEVTIVGVVGDVRHNALNQPAYPHIYLSHNQEPWGSLSVVVRATGSVPIAAALRENIRALDDALPVAIRRMDEVRAASIGRPRFFMLLVGSFGVTALALALVGIIGVVGYLVGERTREIGVRVALGARSREILGLVLRQGMRPVAAGLCFGVFGAFALGRVVAGQLYDVRPTDPVSFTAATALLLIAALLACLIPAHRAARTQPAIALRSE